MNFAAGTGPSCEGIKVCQMILCYIIWYVVFFGCFFCWGRGGVRLEVEASGEKVPRWNIQEFGF